MQRQFKIEITQQIKIHEDFKRKSKLHWEKTQILFHELQIKKTPHEIIRAITRHHTKEIKIPEDVKKSLNIIAWKLPKFHRLKHIPHEITRTLKIHHTKETLKKRSKFVKTSKENQNCSVREKTSKFIEDLRKNQNAASKKTS